MKITHMYHFSQSVDSSRVYFYRIWLTGLNRLRWLHSFAGTARTSLHVVIFLITYGRRVFSIKKGLVTRVSVCVTFANAPLAKASQLARFRVKMENSKITVQNGVHVGMRTICGHFRIWNKGSIHLDL